MAARACIQLAILLLTVGLACTGRSASPGTHVPAAGGGVATAGASSLTGASGSGTAGTPGAQPDPLAEPEPDPNLVPFECQPGLPAVGLRRIVRLNAAQFPPSLRAVCDALNVAVPAGVAPPFDYVNVADRFSTFSRSYGMNDAELQSVWDMASYAADAMSASLMNERPCLLDAAALGTCVAEIASSAAQAAYRRPLSAEELGRLANLALESAEQLGTQQAVATLLQFVLMSPEFLFRTEMGGAAPADAMARALTPEEQAAAVSFTVDNEPPDAALVAAALAGPAELAKEVTARLASLHEDSACTPKRRLARPAIA